jgi:hypothetical protein
MRAATQNANSSTCLRLNSFTLVFCLTTHLSKHSMTGPEDQVNLLEDSTNVHKHWKGGLVASQRCDTDEDLCCQPEATIRVPPQPNLEGKQL